jgi:hypothetical protein
LDRFPKDPHRGEQHRGQRLISIALTCHVEIDRRPPNSPIANQNILVKERHIEDGASS